MYLIVILNQTEANKIMIYYVNFKKEEKPVQFTVALEVKDYLEVHSKKVKKGVWISLLLEIPQDDPDDPYLLKVNFAEFKNLEEARAAVDSAHKHLK